MMFSLSFYPAIAKPTRITSSCATIIDSIFTISMTNYTISGLLIWNITDPLLINNRWSTPKCTSSFASSEEKLSKNMFQKTTQIFKIWAKMHNHD